jgi:UDP-glucose 4-epimerase
MRVLVTGSAGRVGRRVVALLGARGNTVVGFDRRPLDRPCAGYREVLGDFADASAVGAAMDGVDAVVHLGALMSWRPADAPAVYAANATGTLALLAAAVQARVRRFVFASSGEVYPEVRARTDPIDETHPCEPVSAYGLSKLIGEHMVAFHRRTAGLPTVVLRFAHTQEAGELLDPESFFSGPRFYLRARIRQQRALGNERALAALVPCDDGTEKVLLQCGEDGRPYRMMIADARDIAEGVLLALDREQAVGQTLNLGPDSPVRFDEATALIAAATGLPVVRVAMPGPAVDYATSNARARALLGFRPRFTFAAMVEEARRGLSRPA